MQLQVKLQKTAVITYLEPTKERTRYRLTYLLFSNEEKGYN